MATAEAKQGNRKAKCLGDLLTARYIQFNGNNRLFAVARNQWDECSIWFDDEGSVSCIGRVSLADNGIKISANRFGIMWESTHKHYEITCIGSKKSNEWH